MPIVTYTPGVSGYLPSSAISNITSGLTSPGATASPDALLTQGVSGALPQYTAANPINSGSTPLAQSVAANSSQVVLLDSTGKPVIPSPQSTINVGGNSVMSFDAANLTTKISPALAIPASGTRIADLTGGQSQIFSGGDIRLLIELVTPLGTPTRYAKQLMECTTMSVSVFRVKDAVRAGGYIGAKGYSRGGRTVAGSLVLTQFSQDVLFEFLSAYGLGESTKDSGFAKLDQLPPFNISLIFTNEYGYASFRRITGVELVTDGTVYSINDAYSEQTISYVASDFSTLMPLTLADVMSPSTATNAAGAREKTPSDCMQQPSSQPLASLGGNGQYSSAYIAPDFGSVGYASGQTSSVTSSQASNNYVSPFQQ